MINSLWLSGSSGGGAKKETDSDPDYQEERQYPALTPCAEIMAEMAGSVFGPECRTAGTWRLTATKCVLGPQLIAPYSAAKLGRICACRELFGACAAAPEMPIGMRRIISRRAPRDRIGIGAGAAYFQRWPASLRNRSCASDQSPSFSRRRAICVANSGKRRTMFICRSACIRGTAGMPM